jgi:hypothetical protein
MIGRLLVALWLLVDGRADGDDELPKDPLLSV